MYLCDSARQPYRLDILRRIYTRLIGKQHSCFTLRTPAQNDDRDFRDAFRPGTPARHLCKEPRILRRPSIRVHAVEHRRTRYYFHFAFFKRSRANVNRKVFGEMQLACFVRLHSGSLRGEACNRLLQSVFARGREVTEPLLLKAKPPAPPPAPPLCRQRLVSARAEDAHKSPLAGSPCTTLLQERVNDSGRFQRTALRILHPGLSGPVALNLSWRISVFQGDRHRER